MYPKTQFKDTVDRVEKLCHSKRMHVGSLPPYLISRLFLIFKIGISKRLAGRSQRPYQRDETR
jgi:hypothetical protein